jgi:hypothetical protein
MAESITAGATVVLALLTLFIVYFGRKQLQQARDESRKWKTLEVCQAYEQNPCIEGSARRVYESCQSGELAKNPKTFGRDAITLLNYLDGVAIGVSQGLYIENLAKDHLKEIVSANVKRFLLDGKPELFGIDDRDYQFLLAMHSQWNAQKPYYSSAASSMDSLSRKAGRLYATLTARG